MQITLEEFERMKTNPRNVKKRAKSTRPGLELTMTAQQKREIRMAEEKTGTKVLIDTADLLTEKQDMYCYQRAMGTGRRMAYIRAGYTPSELNSQDAYLLERKPKIQKRIEEYREQIRDQRAIGSDQILARYELLYNMAIDSDDFRTALAIMDKISVLTGNALEKGGKPTGYTQMQEAEGLSDLKTSQSPSDNLKRMKDILGKAAPIMDVD